MKKDELLLAFLMIFDLIYFYLDKSSKGVKPENRMQAGSLSIPV